MAIEHNIGVTLGIGVLRAAIEITAAAVVLIACGGSEGEPRSGSAAPDLQDQLRQQLRPALDPGSTVAQLQAAVVAAAADATAHANLAEGLLRRGSYAACLEAVARGLEQFPDDARLQYVAGEAHKRVGQYERAVVHLRRLVAKAPDFADGHLSLCGAFAHRAPAAAAGTPAKVIQSDLDSAVVHCATAVSLEPDNPAFHYNLGRALHLQNEFEAASDAYQQAIGLGHEGAEVQRQLGKALERAGDLAGARIALRMAAGDSSDAETQYLLAKLLDREGEASEAVRLYRRSLELRPDVADVHYNLGRAYYKLGREADGDRHMAIFEELNSGERVGLRDLELGVQRDPANAGQRRALASAYADAGKYGQAAEELRIAAAQEPAHAATHFNLGLMLARTGHVEGAVQVLEHAAVLAPDSARYHLRLGRACARGALDGRAERAFGRAVELEPGLISARFDLALLLERNNRRDEAADQLRAVLEAEPRHLGARFQLAVVLLKEGRHGDAASHLERVVEEEPDYPKAAALLEAVRSHLERGQG